MLHNIGHGRTIRAQPRRPCPSKGPREAKGGTLPDPSASILWDAAGVAAGGRVACGLTKGPRDAYR